MVLMNLFAEQPWRHREQTYGQGQGEEGEGEMERAAWKHIHRHM